MGKVRIQLIALAGAAVSCYAGPGGPGAAVTETSGPTSGATSPGDPGAGTEGSGATGATKGTAGTGGTDGDTTDGGPSPLACDSGSPNTGRAPLRRLTRREYEATIRDLLGVSFPEARAFLGDEKVALFDSNLVAPITELAIEQYASAGETIASRAAARLAELAPCDPARPPRTCASDFIEAFGLRAYRRPLSNAERDAWLSVYDVGADPDGYASGIELVIEAALQSPHFLYHGDLSAELAANPTQVVQVSAYETASRLSFFLWGSMPDTALFNAAREGRLATADGVALEARRLLASPRVNATLFAFHEQWLLVDRLAAAPKDTTTYPAWNDALQDAMVEELHRVSAEVFAGDGKLATLFLAPRTFANEALLAVYAGDTKDTGPAATTGFRPVEFDPTRRQGLLTLLAPLAATSHQNQSSPVLRGKLIRENILCEKLPAPPPDVQVVAPEVNDEATTRERFDQHRVNPSCAACHRLLDPIGFAFENYDGIGRYRTTENGKPIDASGEIIGATDPALQGPVQDATELSARLAKSETVAACVATQWMRYASGRPVSDDDACSQATIREAFAASDYDLRELLVAIARSDAFRFTRLEP